MTTFNIDTTPTKYKEILDSIKEQGRSLKAIHNPQTWRLSALTFALHLYDCTILFEGLRDRWKTQLPFSEAWDVDFSVWKNSIWSVVIDTNSFTSSDNYDEWKQLCDSDINDFIAKASECLNGNVPISEVMDFLKDKETELSEVVINMGRELSAVLAEIDDIATVASKEQFVDYYDNLMNLYLKEQSDNPYPVKMGDNIISLDKWIASKTENQRKKAIPTKLGAINSNMLKDLIWMEAWEENVGIEQRFIDKEGIGREIFIKRKTIIEDSIPCYEIMYNLFSSLALCTHLWNYLASQNEGAFDNLPERRKEIIGYIEELIEKGDWVEPASVETMCAFMRQVLGVGTQVLTEDEEKLSQILWSLFEKRRGGDAFRVTWQNLIGYFDDNGLFGHAGGSPALNEQFFGNNDNYSNIDKGRINAKDMLKAFKNILPLLNTYLPQKR